jgi:hypothetical protein
MVTDMVSLIEHQLRVLTYQPQRLLVMVTKAQDPSHVVETLFKGYGDIAGFPSLPKYIHISVDGQQADQMELLQVKVNQNIPESYFQWEKIILEKSSIFHFVNSIKVGFFLQCSVA